MIIRKTEVVAAAIAAGLAAGVAAASTGTPASRGSCTNGNTVNGAIRFCGPATAHLSVFKGATFRQGTCRHTVVNGVPSLFLKLGARSLKNPLQKGGTNGGLAYFDFSVIGLSHPRGGGVIAFWKGKHWYGRGTSFRGTARAGTFTAQGIPQRGSHGTATGSFRC
jgi:hypothetical protein